MAVMGCQVVSIKATAIIHMRCTSFAWLADLQRMLQRLPKMGPCAATTYQPDGLISMEAFFH